MKVEEVPQDNENVYGERCKAIQYAVNKNGKYEQVKSVGIDPVNTTLKQAWEDVETELSQALLDVKNKIKSPVYYFMKKEIMDIGILSETTGIAKWRIKRHFNPKYFLTLKPKTINQYLEAFKLTDKSELYNIIDK